MPQKLLLYIRYDGAHFCGYQTQQNGYSVQQALNEGTADLFGHPCDITGCSRTDSGVHAHMFCATVTAHGEDHLTTSIPIDRIPRALNTRLPDAVAAYDALWVPTDFHARYSVSSKEYIYRIHNATARDPFEAGRAWHFPRKIDEASLTAMQKAAIGFVGRRDFAACMASGSQVQNTVRHVRSAGVERAGDIIIFRVRADGFLYNMVRILTGTLVEVGLGKRKPEEMKTILAAMNREAAGMTAPPEGLFLESVEY